MNTNEQETRQITPKSQRREGERAGSTYGPEYGAGRQDLDVARRREHTDAAYADLDIKVDGGMDAHDALVPAKQIAAW
jgi:hypothetical protein